MEDYSISRFADVLRSSGFDDGRWRTMRASADGAITVNLTALTAQEQGLARAALAEWATIINVHFVEATGGAQITYTHEGSGANTTTRYSGSRIIDATIAIATSRVGAGDDVGSYVFRTYMHETAHALGLGHPQDYSVVRDFSQSAIGNDSWQMSLLSYFDQNENTAIDATKAYNLTPMAADYVAMRAAYGGVAVRAGDTTYGVGSTAGGTLDRAAAIGRRAAFLISDSGGSDTISFAGFTDNQRIDLRPGAISGVMGGTGNMQIAPDTLIEHATGGLGDDVLIGNGANNRLNGGGGSDLLQGGGGNDTYIVDGNDRVVEAAGGGIDTVWSSASIVLGGNVENLVLTGSAAIDGRGNGLSNTITGNGAANVLNGEGGFDRLIGGGGDDTYIWGAGDRIVEEAGGGIDTVRTALNHALPAWVENLILTGAAIIGTGNDLGNAITGNARDNRLDGRGGADTLVGGAGNDTYLVDGADTVIEARGGGIDRVISTEALSLGAHVERGRLNGIAAVSLIGNGLDNLLEGNIAANLLRGEAGNDTLNGSGGADTLIGGAGDDVYTVDGSDLVIEAPGGGIDSMVCARGMWLAPEVERGVLTGMADVNLHGNNGDNVLFGNAGDNQLEGGAGDDMMTGRGGADCFVFADGVDRIVDFVDGVDQIAFRGAALGIATVAAALATAAQTAEGVWFTFDQDRLLVSNATLAQVRDDVILI